MGQLAGQVARDPPFLCDVEGGAKRRTDQPDIGRPVMVTAQAIKGWACSPERRTTELTPLAIAAVEAIQAAPE
jgi:hypothetical protein